MAIAEAKKTLPIICTYTGPNETLYQEEPKFKGCSSFCRYDSEDLHLKP
jgi:hypothetical protein